MPIRSFQVINCSILKNVEKWWYAVAPKFDVICKNDHDFWIERTKISRKTTLKLKSSTIVLTGVININQDLFNLVRKRHCMHPRLSYATVRPS